MATIESVANAAATSKVAQSRATIADNFDTFLNILTTQLKNQNPLDPLDTNQFTSNWCSSPASSSSSRPTSFWKP